MLDDEVKESPISYPDSQFIADKTTVFVNLSDEANLKMQTLWTDMKSAEDENSNRWIVPVFLVFCILLMIFVLVRRYIKRKKDIF